MNMYHVDGCEFEIRTRIYKAIGYKKKSTVQYSLYQEEKAHIFRNFRRGLITEFQMDTALLQIQQYWFSEWKESQYKI